MLLQRRRFLLLDRRRKSEGNEKGSNFVESSTVGLVKVWTCQLLEDKSDSSCGEELIKVALM